MADVCKDYNYIVDCLEDEHQRREVHTISDWTIAKQFSPIIIRSIITN